MEYNLSLSNASVDGLFNFYLCEYKACARAFVTYTRTFLFLAFIIHQSTKNYANYHSKLSLVHALYAVANEWKYCIALPCVHATCLITAKFFYKIKYWSRRIIIKNSKKKKNKTMRTSRLKNPRSAYSFCFILFCRNMQIG